MSRTRAREADPMTQISGLQKALASKEPLAPAYLLRGDEPYFRERAIARIRERADKEELEITAHDSSDPDFSLARLLEDLSGGGLFAAARCVVVRSADALVKKAGKDDAPLVKSVRAALESEGFAGTIVVAANSLRADHRLAKAVAAAGGVSVSCRKLYDSPPPWNPDPREAELVRFVGLRSRTLGLNLEPAAAVYVAAATGNDLFAIDDQLEKLRHVPPGERRKALGWEAAGNPFQVADDLARGNAARAVSGLESLFRSGFQERDGKRLLDPAGLVAILVGSLRRNVRESLSIARTLEAGGAPRSGGGAPRPAALERSRKRPAARWERMLDEVADLERRSKTGATVDANDLSLLALRWRA